jgi:hypothetical protein
MSSPTTSRLLLSSPIPTRLAFALFAFSGALLLAGPQAHAQAGDDCSTAFIAVEGSNRPSI